MAIIGVEWIVYVVGFIIVLYVIGRLMRRRALAPLTSGHATSSVEDFLTFRWYITPSFIMLVYALGAFSITGLAALFIYQAGAPLGGLYVILGITTLIFGNLTWRLLCEYFVVQFRIHDALRSIDSRLDVFGEARTIPATRPVTPVIQAGAPRRCPNCGSENRGAAKFCKSCAQRLEPEKTETHPTAHPGPILIICDQCGIKNEPSNKYCDNCGTKLT